MHLHSANNNKFICVYCMHSAVGNKDTYFVVVNRRKTVHVICQTFSYYKHNHKVSNNLIFALQFQVNNLKNTKVW